MKVLVVNITKPNIDMRSIKLKRALEKMGHKAEFYWPMRRQSPRLVRHLFNFVETLVVAIRGDYDVAHLIDGWDIALLPFLVSSKPKVFDIRSLWPYMLRRV
ncbi:MAG: hypothetical protein ACYTFW_09305, partial [Planctomycetota bacterium]